MSLRVVIIGSLESKLGWFREFSFLLPAFGSLGLVMRPLGSSIQSYVGHHGLSSL